MVEGILTAEQTRLKLREDEHDQLWERMREISRVSVESGIADIRGLVRELKRQTDSQNDQIDLFVAQLTAIEQRPRSVTSEDLEKAEKRILQLQVRRELRTAPASELVLSLTEWFWMWWCHVIG